jgi:hypothetical protein
MTDSPSPAERAAIREGYSALIRAKSPTSHIVETVTFALSESGQLVAPGGAFELDRLRKLMNAQPAALTEDQIDALVDAGDRVVNDANHQDLCACDGWPTECRHYVDGQWDTGALAFAIPAIVGLWEVMRAAAAAEATATVRGACPTCGSAPEQWCTACASCPDGCDGGHKSSEPCPERMPEALIASSGAVIETTRTDDARPQLAELRALLAGQREDVAASPLHHDYRIGRDLPEVRP